MASVESTTYNLSLSLSQPPSRASQSPSLSLYSLSPLYFCPSVPLFPVSISIASLTQSLSLSSLRPSRSRSPSPIPPLPSASLPTLHLYLPLHSTSLPGPISNVLSILHLSLIPVSFFLCIFISILSLSSLRLSLNIVLSRLHLSLRPSLWSTSLSISPSLWLSLSSFHLSLYMSGCSLLLYLYPSPFASPLQSTALFASPESIFLCISLHLFLLSLSSFHLSPVYISLPITIQYTCGIPITPISPQILII